MEETTNEDLDALAITTLRTLSIDAVENAGSGYPGTAMALAPALYTIYTEHLRYDPQDPLWENRDRFVLSVGHAGILLYSMLLLADVRSVDPGTGPVGEPAMTVDELRQYRQGEGRATGHPEHGVLAGIETSTGPLGQGLANSVGMAVAQRWKAATFDVDKTGLFDHEVIALGGDGDVMEGIAYEAASYAGHQKLSNLCWIYDNNSISIEGSTNLAFTEDVSARFAALGWNVIKVADANDRDAIRAALAAFRVEQDRPTFIDMTSVIGWGSPNRAGTQPMHGIPMGPEETAATKDAYGWPTNSSFLIPDEVREHVKATFYERGQKARTEWNTKWDAFTKAQPEFAGHIAKMANRELPDGWDSDLPSWDDPSEMVAGREASFASINAIGPKFPWLLGGASDTAMKSMTLMWFPEAGGNQPDTPWGRNMHYGTREHAMSAIANGLALSNVRTYDSTYLVFSEYGRGAIRLSALMGLPVIHVLTNDSFRVGSDGPTHQPIDHLASYRAMPNLTLVRPADANETVEAWKLALERTDGPTIISIAHQKVPVIDRTTFAPASGVTRGGYVLADPPDGAAPDAIIIATGAEVHLAMATREALANEGIHVRVVNLASWEIFEEQDEQYRQRVLPSTLGARVTVEEGASQGWHRYAGEGGEVIGIDRFGKSGPVPMLEELFGFTTNDVSAAVKRVIANNA